jgi:hypothetical protein
LPAKVESYPLNRSAPSPSSSKKKKTIAICIIIVDELPHEDIWQRWLDGGGSGEYEGKIVIHAKHPSRITSPWMRERLISKSFTPEWNSPEVIRAILACLEAACEDEDVIRCVSATESCIPLFSLQETGVRLCYDENSWLDAYQTPKSAWEAGNCFRAVNDKIIPLQVRIIVFSHRS